jgi:hypothetical protein
MPFCNHSNNNKGESNVSLIVDRSDLILLMFGGDEKRVGDLEAGISWQRLKNTA